MILPFFSIFRTFYKNISLLGLCFFVSISAFAKDNTEAIARRCLDLVSEMQYLHDLQTDTLCKKYTEDKNLHDAAFSIYYRDIIKARYELGFAFDDLNRAKQQACKGFSVMDELMHAINEIDNALAI